jgi:ribosomal protein S6E (S10)
MSTKNIVLLIVGMLVGLVVLCCGIFGVALMIRGNDKDKNTNTSTTKEPKVYAMSETAKMGDFEYQVSKVQDLGAKLTPRANTDATVEKCTSSKGRYVAVEVKVKNTGTTDVKGSDMRKTVIYESKTDPYVNKQPYFSCQYPLGGVGSLTVKPGETFTYTIMLDIPTGAKNFFLDISKRSAVFDKENGALISLESGL